MRRTRTAILVLLTITLCVVCALWIVLHLERSQRKVWSLVAEKVDESSCLRLDVEHFSYRLWPARVWMRGLTVSDNNGGGISVDSIDATWSWLQIVRKPTRLRSLSVSGLEVAFDRLPEVCTNPADEAQTDPWHAFAIDELTVRDTNLGAAADGLALSLEGVGVEGALKGGQLDLHTVADTVIVEKMERVLELSGLSATLTAGDSGIEIKQFAVAKGPLTAEGAGAMKLGPVSAAEGRFAVAPDLAALMDWWDPALAQRLRPEGRLSIIGEAIWDPSRGVGLQLSHEGPGAALAGYGLQKAVVSLADGTLTASASGPGWGRAKTTIAGGTRLELELELDETDPRPAIRAGGIALPPWLPPEARLSGHATASLSLPFALDRLNGSTDLEAHWPQGRVALSSTAANGKFDLDSLELDFLGMKGHATGSIDSTRHLQADGTISIDDPASITSGLARLAPNLVVPPLNGGPIMLEFDLSGTATQPLLNARATWSQPSIGDIGLTTIEATTTGSLAEIAWTTRIVGRGESVVEAQGTADRDLTVAGEWSLTIADLGEAAELWPNLPLPALAGSLAGGGDFTRDGAAWTVAGGFEARDIVSFNIAAPAIDLDFTADPKSVSVSRLVASVLDGSVGGTGRLDLSDAEPRADLRLDWQGLQPSVLFVDLPPAAQGELAGSITASGTLSAPSANARLEWASTFSTSPLENATLAALLEGGTVRIISESVRTAAGPLIVRAELPMGSLERPPWLLPDAPGGAWRLDIDGQRLRLAPVLASFDYDDYPVDGIADLEASVQWHPGHGGPPQLQLSLLDAAVSGAGQEFIAAAPVRLAFDGREFVLGDVMLQGEHGHFAIGGSFDVTALEIDVSADGRLDPALARLIPYPVSIQEPMNISVRADGPISSLGGTIAVDHTGGLIEIRDPPMQIADLRLEAGIRGGVLDVHEGQARVNEGMVYLGGGWNPSVQQGLVAELEDVLFLLGDGILTKWDGAVAIEPAENSTALVVGELILDQGLWDSPFDLAGAFLGGNQETVDADHISHTIKLDLDVRGHGGIHVDNNLGNFDLRWNLLEIWGSVAEPHLGGDINILPGGTIRVAGQTIPLRRGLVQFTGDPLVDPLLEIVPEHDVMASPDGKGSSDLTGIATSGLSAGLGTVLGLENTTIRPEDIAIDTDSDTSTEFSIGQQLTHSTALFLTTDLRNSQKRTSLLQLWRIPTLPGLTIQAMTRTDPGEADLRLLQRFSWGGTKASVNQPRLHKIKLEGEWPASKRRLIKASGLVRDQPWDHFLLFLGTVRLERDLARRGYPEANVDARAEGPDVRPRAVFVCEPGPQVNVEFEGDRLPRRLRSRVVSLYRFPPLEETALENMRTVILRHLWSEGHPEARAELLVGDDGTVHVSVDAGEERKLVGPFLEHAPPETVATLTSLLGTPTELAEVARDPRRAERVAQRVLATAGFRDVQSVESWTETLEDSTSVRIRIDAGIQSTVTRFEVDGKDPLNLTTDENFNLREGMALDRAVIDRSVSDLRAAYRAEGYTEAKVRTHLTEVKAGDWDLRLELDVGTTAVVSRVDIDGRRHLGDFAVRHGVAVQPGALFRLEDLDETVGRIATFGPIERVEASITQTNGEVVVDLNVTERNRWSVEAGGGWNSDRGVTARASVGDSNLFGRGAGATLLSRWEKDFLQGRLVLSLPPLPGGRFTAGIIASYTEDVLNPEQEGDVLINEHIREATIEGTYQLSRSMLGRAYYRFSRTRTFEPDPFDPFWALDITTDLGLLGTQLIVDRLDNPFDPRSGYYAGLDLSWAGEALGSDTENIRALLSTSLSLEPRRDWTWFQSLRIGAARPINGVLDRQSRFFAGGAASIRGFELDSVGPVEVLGGQVFYAGGEALFVLNEELRIPVWRSLRGAIFIDTGQVWETWSDADFSFSVGAGFGIRWGTPVGPLWADVAWPVANRGLNSGARFSFGIGRTF